jgi:hypothetical protein
MYVLSAVVEHIGNLFAVCKIVCMYICMYICMYAYTHVYVCYIGAQTPQGLSYFYFDFPNALR